MVSFPRRSLLISPAALFAVLALAGCHITTNKHHGKNDNVDIGTPFGSMSVKTNDQSVNASLGISAYPGAVPVRDEKDGNDNGAADVNMSFGNFHLGVIARSFQTPDKSDKVLAFYRKDLAHFGEVIQCKGNQTVGLPARTSQGLSCTDKDNNHVSANDSGDGLELRAGSPVHQHIVAVEDRDGGTRIGLVKLDLPGELNHHDKSQSE